MMEQTFELRTQISLEALEPLRRFTRESLARARCAQDDIQAVQLAVHEACSNILKHGYPADRAQRPVALEITVDDRAIRAVLRDQGAPLPPWVYNQKFLKAMKQDQQAVHRHSEGGVGSFLIANLIDHVHPARHGLTNTLEMVRQKRQKGPGGGSIAHLLRDIPLKAYFNTLTLLIVVTTVVLIIFLVLKDESRTLKERAVFRGLWLAKSLSSEGVSPILTRDTLTLSALAATASQNPDVVYAVFVDGRNRILADSERRRFGSVFKMPGEVQEQFNRDETAGRYIATPAGQILDLEEPVVVERGGEQVILGRLHIGLDQKSIEKLVREAVSKALSISFLILLVALLATTLVVEFISRPIRGLVNGAHKIGEGEFRHRISSSNTKEIGDLAAAFNAMAEKLDTAQQTQKEKLRLEEQLSVAANIQKFLLPKSVPEVRGFDFGMAYQSADQVGGDYLDFIELDHNHVGIVVADVSGKGVPAALVMINVRSSLRAAAAHSRSASEVLKSLNAALARDTPPDRFVTMLYCVLDVPAREITFASAGHCPLLLYEASENRVSSHRTEGFPLCVDGGKLFDKAVQEKKIKLHKGDSVVLITDGIIEAMNRERQQFGDARLTSAVQRFGKDGARDICGQIQKEVGEFVKDQKQSDDYSLTIIKAG